MEDSPEKEARPAKQPEAPRAKKPRTLATALQSVQQNSGTPCEFRELAEALECTASEGPEGKSALVEYFKAKLIADNAGHSLVLALELLGSSAPGCPQVREVAIKRAANVVFQAGLPLAEGEEGGCAAAILEASNNAPESHAETKAVTLEDVARVRFAAFQQGEDAVRLLDEVLRNSEVEAREVFHIVSLLEGSGPEPSAVFEALGSALVGLSASEAPFAHTWESTGVREYAAKAFARASELAFGECGGLAGRLVEALLAGAQAPALYKHCSPQVGQPLLPMTTALTEVAQGDDGIDRALCDATGAPVVLERLYSGCRVQVHKQGDDVKIFDACQQDLAKSGRDRLVSGIRTASKFCNTCVLDGVLQKDGNYLRFIAFDCLWLNGKVLVRRPLLERREALRRALTKSDVVSIAAAQEFSLGEPPTARAVRSFLFAASTSGCKGALLKRLDGIYEAGCAAPSWFSLAAEPRKAAEPVNAAV